MIMFFKDFFDVNQNAFFTHEKIKKNIYANANQSNISKNLFETSK